MCFMRCSLLFYPSSCAGFCRNVVYHLRHSHFLQSCTLFSDPYMIRHVYNYIIYIYILLVKKHFENDPTQFAGFYVIGKYFRCVGF